MVQLSCMLLLPREVDHAHLKMEALSPKHRTALIDRSDGLGIWPWSVLPPTWQHSPRCTGQTKPYSNSGTCNTQKLCCISHLKIYTLNIIVVIQDGVLAGGGGVGSDGATIEDTVAVPEHVKALAKVFEALWLGVHGSPAVRRTAHAPACIEHTFTPCILPQNSMHLPVSHWAHSCRLHYVLSFCLEEWPGDILADVRAQSHCRKPGKPARGKDAFLYNMSSSECSAVVTSFR